MDVKLATVTKQLSFDSAHYLVNQGWTREVNMKMFHKCCLYKEDGEDEAHGHTYHLHVYVTGYVSDNDGFVIDFKDLKRILKDGVVERLDHRLINNIPYFKNTGTLATVENILHYVWDEIQPEIDALRPNEAWLSKIKMYETPDSFATLNRRQWAREMSFKYKNNIITGDIILTNEEFEKMKAEAEKDGN